MIARTFEHVFDLALSRTEDRRVAFDVRAAKYVSVQIVTEYNISGAFAVAVERSNDGVTGAEPEEGAQSLTASGAFSETLLCVGYSSIIVRVSTNATSGRVRALVCMKEE